MAEPTHRKGSSTTRFAEQLRMGRARLGITKAEFCARAGITANTLRALERGVQTPKPKTLERITRLIGTAATVDGHDARIADLNGEDLAIAHAFHNAPSRVREWVHGVLQQTDKLQPRHQVPEVTQVAEQLLRLPPGNRYAIDRMIAVFVEQEELRQELAAARSVAADNGNGNGRVLRTADPPSETVAAPSKPRRSGPGPKKR